jgi:formate-dependent nitrite reductase membrane component NrfD
VFLVVFLAAALGVAPVDEVTQWVALWTALVFLALTLVLLVLDLDQPGRFIYVLLRPNWSSWLVRGGYALLLYSGFLVTIALAKAFKWGLLEHVAVWGGAILAVITAVYTAFLFAQAKGRDLWLSRALSLHMLVQSLMAGAAFCLLVGWLNPTAGEWMSFLRIALAATLLANLAIVAAELTSHRSADARRAVQMIVSGPLRGTFWIGGVVLGHLLPISVILVPVPALWPFAAAASLVGLYLIDHVWVRAPQRVPLS